MSMKYRKFVFLGITILLVSVVFGMSMKEGLENTVNVTNDSVKKQLKDVTKKITTINGISNSISRNLQRGKLPSDKEIVEDITKLTTELNNVITQLNTIKDNTPKIQKPPQTTTQTTSKK